MRAIVRAVRDRRLWHRWNDALSGNLVIGERSAFQARNLVVRGGQGSGVRVGSDSLVEGLLVLERDGAQITVGDRTFIGGKTLLGSAHSISIGDDVLISFEVLIMDHDGHSLEFSQRASDVADWARGRKDWTHVPRRAIRVENRSWIGSRATILRGVTIGEGAVVGSGSVVTKDVEPWCVVAGNPARPIRQLEPVR